jgi:hypothetical protein
LVGSAQIDSWTGFTSAAFCLNQAATVPPTIKMSSTATSAWARSVRRLVQDNHAMTAASAKNQTM